MTEILLTLTQLPLFPLDTVLFPGGHLSLKVFEVRYLDMVRRCHEAGAPFGVVSLRQGSEVIRPGAPDEQLESIGTLAHIASLVKEQPGLLSLQCAGAQRFRIDRQSRLKHGLWVADVTLLADDATVPVPTDLTAVAQALQQVRAKLQLRPGGAQDYGDADAHYDDCAWVSNRWCELLPLPAATRQRLMSLDNPLLRLELVADFLAKAGIGTSTP
ncbi:LON peptidase substrate-binding domain-containing protein [Ottowia oryzae]|uniref:Peptidase S16 n=1 Tax=Ottowia oryzae TaxID=2109914 RepID=A0A2S0MGR4_9BURK|nr:LON peptidase substrate-binding domain-containing protein [Ottowia oryzae]AVO35084.1 peptidase S16 [Ottowia oryzae]